METGPDGTAQSPCSRARERLHTPGHRPRQHFCQLGTCRWTPTCVQRDSHRSLEMSSHTEACPDLHPSREEGIPASTSLAGLSGLRLGKEVSLSSVSFLTLGVSEGECEPAWWAASSAEQHRNGLPVLLCSYYLALCCSHTFSYSYHGSSPTGFSSEQPPPGPLLLLSPLHGNQTMPLTAQPRTPSPRLSPSGPLSSALQAPLALTLPLLLDSQISRIHSYSKPSHFMFPVPSITYTRSQHQHGRNGLGCSL